MTNLQDMSQKLDAKLDQLQGKKVFIFGDVGIDEYVSGDVRRISPEAPVPVVEVNQTDKKLGLSGNVAANVKSLGGVPLMFSLIGQDRNGEQLKALLSEKGISPDYLMIDPKRETTTKLRVMSGQHHVVRVDYENRSPMDSDTLNSFSKTLEEGIEQSDTVIIQDYAKGQINEASCQMVMELAKNHGKPVMVDPYRSTPLRTYRGAQFMTPNRDEAFDLAKQIPKPEIWNQVDQIGLELMKAIESPQMVVTLGAEGVKIFDGEQVSHLPTFAQKVFDVTGAGDTVIAAFSLGMSAGWDIKDSAFLANMAAGVVVGHVGAVACSLEELRQFLAQH